MSVNHAEKEREFITALKADTGHDLAGWLQAIDAQSLTERNDIIDWLRHQGFHFAWASWLERIHHNGGQLVYAGVEPREFGNFRRRPQNNAQTPSALAIAKPTQTVTVAEARDLQPQQTRAHDPDRDALLASAKAFRPLAKHVLLEIERKLGVIALAVHAHHFSISREESGEFAVLAVSPKELRLGLALGDRPFDEHVFRAKFPAREVSVGPHISHMVVLTDARQVNPQLLALVQAAFNGARE